ncbi:2-hydroxyacyl-CoA dehydratase [Pseudonocardia sp. DLS-67]
MTMPQVGRRLRTVEAVRRIQREWVARTREEVAAGGPFGICNGDEFEEIFTAMGIPALAVNYWNYLVLAKGGRDALGAVLHRAGYPGTHFFGLALASAMEPELAPWGGLPQPSIVCGSTRNEMELRVCELWAEAMGCPCVAMDFSFPSSPFRPLPREWWRSTAHDWESLVDPDRLDYRVQLERDVIAQLEAITGRTFSTDALVTVLNRINEQMALWVEAQAAIGAAARCPVHIRDQMSMYQAMWHRGTERGIELIRAYRDEILERVESGVAAYPLERHRLYYSGQVPPWHAAIEQEHGAVTVACSYSCIPELYERRFDRADPLRALAARHMFLFDWGPYRILDVARRQRCDAVVVVEQAGGTRPSEQARIVEDAGMPYLAVPRDADDSEVRGLISRFITDRLD